MGDFRPLYRVNIKGAKFQPINKRGSMTDSCQNELECDPPNNLFSDDNVNNPYVNVSEKIGNRVAWYCCLNVLTILIYIPLLRFKGTKGTLGYLN